MATGLHTSQPTPTLHIYPSLRSAGPCLFHSLILSFVLTDPGCELPRGLQLCCGRPDLPGIRGQRPVVRRAARDHLWWWAEELPRQVGDVIASPSLGIALCYAGAVWPPLRGPEFGSSDTLFCFQWA